MTFATPQLLWLLVLLAAAIVYSFRVARLKRLALAQWGAESLFHRRIPWALLTALGMIVIVLAGPRWGIDELPGIVKGRDIVFILDLSRSMEAADMADPHFPQRWQSGREALLRLFEDLKQRGGGHRVAIVVFAAKPIALCPLTVDYDFALDRLNDLSGAAPPLGTYPNEDETWTSGTRIGAAIRLAVETHDPRFEGYQDCLLISDGDDPAPDRDSEIDSGIAAATKQRIPIHVAGVGDPKEGGQIVVDEQFIRTKLEEVPLKSIARRTEGIYLPAEREVPALAKFFREKIEPRPSRELPEEVLPQPKERRIWLVLPAIALLCLAWWRE